MLLFSIYLSGFIIQAFYYDELFKEIVKESPNIDLKDNEKTRIIASGIIDKYIPKNLLNISVLAFCLTFFLPFNFLYIEYLKLKMLK